MLLCLIGQEVHSAALSTALNEYVALTELEIFKNDSWPLQRFETDKDVTAFEDIVEEQKRMFIDSGTKFFVADRYTVHTRFQTINISIPVYGVKAITFPRSFNFFRQKGRFATFLELADHRGFVLVKNRSNDTRAARFVSLRHDSFNHTTGDPTLRLYYRVSPFADPVEVHPTLRAAVAAARSADLHDRLRAKKGIIKKLSKFGDRLKERVKHITTRSFYPPLMPRAMIVIGERHVSHTGGKFGFNVSVGKLATGLGYTGWIILDHHNNALNSDLDLLGVELALHDSDVTLTANDEREIGDLMYNFALELDSDEMAHNTAVRHHKVWRDTREHHYTAKFKSNAPTDADTVVTSGAPPHMVPTGVPIDGVYPEKFDIASCRFLDLPAEIRERRIGAARESWETLVSVLKKRPLRALQANAAFLHAASATQHAWWWKQTHGEQAVPYKFLTLEERKGSNAQTRVTMMMFEIQCKAKRKADQVLSVRAKWKADAAAAPLRSVRRKKQTGARERRLDASGFLLTLAEFTERHGVEESSALWFDARATATRIAIERRADPGGAMLTKGEFNANYGVERASVLWESTAHTARFNSSTTSATVSGGGAFAVEKTDEPSFHTSLGKINTKSKRRQLRSRMRTAQSKNGVAANSTWASGITAEAAATMAAERAVDFSGSSMVANPMLRVKSKHEAPSKLRQHQRQKRRESHAEIQSASAFSPTNTFDFSGHNPMAQTPVSVASPSRQERDVFNVSNPLAAALPGAGAAAGARDGEVGWANPMHAARSTRRERRLTRGVVVEESNPMRAELSESDLGTVGSRASTRQIRREAARRRSTTVKHKTAHRSDPVTSVDFTSPVQSEQPSPWDVGLDDSDAQPTASAPGPTPRAKRRAALRMSIRRE